MHIVCPNCGAERPDTDGFCTYCGAPLELEELPCRECRTSNPPTSKFCSECGASLQQAPVPRQVQTRAIAQPQQPAKHRKGKLSDFLLILGIAALITIGYAVIAILGGQMSLDESEETDGPEMKQATSTVTNEYLKATAKQIPFRARIDRP